jgi:RNA polymerase sigma factor (sigma-70 family)
MPVDQELEDKPELSSEPETTSRLVEAACLGDERAYQALVERHYGLVYSTAISVVGLPEPAEEVLQETFLLAWKNLASLKQPAYFPLWVRRISRNVALNWVRSRQARQRLTERYAKELPGSSHELPPSAAPIAAEQRRDSLLQALGRLPATLREPLILYYLEEQSVRVVAEMLQITEGTVNKRLSRARKTLRELLQGDWEERFCSETRGAADRPLVSNIVAGLAMPLALPELQAMAAQQGMALGWGLLRQKTFVPFLLYVLRTFPALKFIAGGLMVGVIATGTALHLYEPVVDHTGLGYAITLPQFSCRFWMCISEETWEPGLVLFSKDWKGQGEGNTVADVPPGHAAQLVLEHPTKADVALLKEVHPYDFQYISITSENLGGQDLAPLRHLKGLHCVHLRGNEEAENKPFPIGADVVPILAALPHLRSLGLYNTTFSDVGMGRLAAQTNLTTLNLIWNGRMSAEGLYPIGFMRDLRWLRISSHYCNREAVHVIGTLTDLEHLELTSLNFDDTFLSPLCNLHALEYLHLCNTCVSFDGVRRLKEVLPKADIYAISHEHF